MATVTGITYAKATEILGQSVVSGVVNSSTGHLILTRQNGTTFDAGDFNSIVEDIQAAAVAAAVDAAVPSAVAGDLFALGNISGTLTMPGGVNSDSLVNALFTATLTGNVTFASSALPGSPRPGTQFAMRLTQDATGGRTLTLTGFKKSQGVLTLTTAANAIDILVFMYDGTQWFAGLMGVDFK